MNKFVLKIEADYFSLEDGITNIFKKRRRLERHCTTAELSVGAHFAENRLMDVVKRHGRKLIVKLNCAVLSMQAFLKILAHMPELERLQFNIKKTYSNGISNRNPSDYRITLKKLEKLVIKCSCKILKVIVAPSLVELRHASYWTYDNNFGPLGKHLKDY